ncbi:MAG: aminotransferase class I/II-fold pyridoxal phosphate-dependent enzyme [Vampirovibrionales bacterium]
MMTTTAPLFQLDMDRLTSDLWKNREEYIMFRISKRVAELTEGLKAKGRAPLSLSIGAPTIPPHQLIVDALMQAMNQPNVHTYSTTRGELLYREACAARLKERFGVEVCPKTEVVSLVGSKEGLAAIFRGLVTPQVAMEERDIVMVPDPGYASYVEAIEGAGGRAYGIPITPANAYLPDMHTVWNEMLASGVDASKVKAFVINYPSNPIGATAPLSYLEHCVNFAREKGILLISDNAYCDMYFAPEAKPHSVLEVPNAKDVAVEFFSLSKPYSMTGWRIGFVAGNRAATDLVALVKSTIDSGLYKAIQHAGAFALTSPAIEANVQEVNKLYAHNQAVFVKALKTVGWPIDEASIPKATFYFWMPIPERYTSCVQFANELLETSGIVTVPGTAFGKNGEGFVRLSLVLPEAQLLEVVERMRTDGFTWQ